eukprot:scaffold190887_cov50-Attheya_sp.AAC.2
MVPRTLTGKSAILAAIQICLGAHARRTHRARNLKELVRKEGSNSGAKVRVTLLNGGEDGYKREMYGDSITIERSITLRGGYNGYRLLDHDGKERSRSKKDLEAMLDQLNIQVDNPVAVLDQEEAKKFLTGRPQDKYDFFAKATELERIDNTYSGTVDNLMELDEQNAKNKENLSSVYTSVKKLKDQWKQFEELDKLQEKIGDLSVQLTWSMYHQQNEKAEQNEAFLRDILEKREKRSQDLAKAEELANVTEDEETSLRDQMTRLTEEAQEAAAAKQGIEAELKEVMAPVKSRERDNTAIRRELITATKRFKRAQKDLQAVRDQITKAAGNAESEEARRVEKVEKAEAELARTKDGIEGKKEDILESLKKYEDLGPHVDQARENTQSISGQINAVNHKLRDLQSASGGNSFTVFGQKCDVMHDLVERAKSAGRFKGPVIGPIGHYIKIAQGKEGLAKVAEFALGSGNLQRFIVTNDADRQLFMKLRTDARCSPRDCMYFQMSGVGSRYAVPPPPTDDVDTVASALSITDNLVFNCLVDNARIEQRALAMSKDQSEKSLLIVQDNGRESIRGGTIKDVFLPNGDNWMVKNGSRTMISNERPLKQTIGVDKTAAIREAKEEAELLQRELDELRRKEDELKKVRKEYQVVWNRETRAHRTTVSRIEELEKQIVELNNEKDVAENNTIDTTEYEEDVQVADEALSKLKDKFVETEKELEDLQSPIAGVKGRLEEITARNERVLSELTAAEEKMEEYVKGNAQRMANVEKRKDKLEKVEDAIGKQKEIVEDLREKRGEALYKARVMTFNTNEQRKKAKEDVSGDGLEDQSFHAHTDADLEAIEPIEAKKEPAFYKARVERATRNIALERDRRQLSNIEPEEAHEQYLRAQHDLDAKLHLINSIDKTCSELRADIKHRMKLFKIFRKHLAETTSNTFDVMLNKKGSSGQLDFDHGDRELNLTVQKDNTNEMSQTKDVKALSGGERSFTTLSLLLALGENLETPFRIMDEFDVFLDPVSRKIALDTMVSVAKDMEHRQFIFITPQDLSGLTTDNKLKIIKMKQPIRSTM